MFSKFLTVVQKYPVNRVVLRHFSKTSVLHEGCCVPRFHFEGKVALVTGASSGIGLACVEALAARGVCGIMVTDIVKDRGEKVVKELNEKYRRKVSSFAELDVTNFKRFDEVFQLTIDKFGSIDILFNNGGMLDETKWEQMVSINFNGVVNGCLLGIEKYMIKYRSGCESIIINCASILGLDPCAVIPIYTGTKHGVIGLTRSYGAPLHYNKTKIRLMALCPGVTITPLVHKVEDKVRAEFIEKAVPQEFGSLPEQAMDCCGMAIIKMIDYGTCGSMWVSEANQCYEVRTPPRQLRRVPLS